MDNELRAEMQIIAEEATKKITQKELTRLFKGKLHSVTTQEIRRMLKDPDYLSEYLISPEQAKAILDAKQLRAQIREIITQLLRGKIEEIIEKEKFEVFREFRKKAYHSIMSMIREIMVSETDLKGMIDTAVQTHAATHFEESIDLCITKSYRKISGRIKVFMKEISSLKTSTIGEIRHYADNDYPLTEEQVLEKLSKIEEKERKRIE